MKIIDDTPVGKPLHLLSITVWAACLLSIPCMLLLGFENFGIGLLLLFACMIAVGLWSQAFGNQMDTPDYKGPRDLLDRVVPYTTLGALGVAGVCFVSLMLSGGGPKIVDGAYAIVNHGKLVLTIGKPWYIYLTCCERLMFPCGLTFFAGFLLMRVHTLYRAQNSPQPPIENPRV